MPKEFKRTDRISELIRRELSKLIQFEKFDIMMPIVTLTHVDVTRDLTQAKIYVTFLIDDPEEIKKSVLALQEKAPIFRKSLARKVRLRQVPELKFCFDKALVENTRLSKLIDSLVPDDDIDKSDPKE